MIIARLSSLHRSNTKARAIVRGEISIGATFSNPNQFSKGIIHVLVGGTFVVRNEELVKSVFAGKPVRAQAQNKGRAQ